MLRSRAIVGLAMSLASRAVGPLVEAAELRGYSFHPGLFPAEQALISHAVAKRRQEFAAGRSCARSALARLGIGAHPILSGRAGAPVWPVGVVGSITHCAGYAAAAVATTQRVEGIGIDAEPARPLPEGVLDVVATTAERDHLQLLRSRYPYPAWDRLLFSAKEATYKFWYPLMGTVLEFGDVEVSFDPVRRCFRSQFRSGPLRASTGPINHVGGRYVADASLLLTSVVLPS